MVVARTFHVTWVIFHNVAHQGWLHSKNDYTLRVIARTFHLMCINFHNGWSHVHPQLATTHTMGTQKLMVVASTFHVTCMIFHNVRHQGWLHSKHDYTLRMMARTFHVMCMNFHNGGSHINPQLVTTLGVTLWKITHVPWKVRATTLCHQPSSMWELIRNNKRHTEIACDYPQ